MKKPFILALVGLLLFALTGCGEVTTDTPTVDTTDEVVDELDLTALPSDLNFPAQADIFADAGSYVFAPDRSAVDEAIEEGTDYAVFNYFFREVVSTGENGSVVKEILDEVTIPNALMIPTIPMGGAQVGDIILTEASSGGMTRAIVTAGGDMPTVKTLDFFNSEITLDSLNYNILTTPGQIGTGVAFDTGYGYEAGTLINVSGNDALILGFGGSLQVISLSDVVYLPITVEVAVGDTVYVPIVASFGEATVTSVDLANGAITAEYEFVGEMEEDTYYFGEISLDEL